MTDNAHRVKSLGPVQEESARGYKPYQRAASGGGPGGAHTAMAGARQYRHLQATSRALVTSIRENMSRFDLGVGESHSTVTKGTIFLQQRL